VNTDDLTLVDNRRGKKLVDSVSASLSDDSSCCFAVMRLAIILFDSMSF